MEPLGGCGQGQEAGRVKEPEHVHIKEEPETWDYQYEDLVKEEPWCVDEVGQEPSCLETASSCGVSSAAMWAGLYSDHTVKDELVLGPELLHRPTVTRVFHGWPLADIDRDREQLQKWSARLARVLRREGTPSPAPSARSHTEQDALSTRGVGDTERAEARRSAKDGAVARGAGAEARSRRCGGRGGGRGLHPAPRAAAPARQCRLCGRRCRSQADLAEHKLTHKGEQRFKCDYCDFKGRYKSDLRRHEMIHSGVTPFKCSSCNYKCKQKAHLRIHEMKHTGETPFKCSICSYRCKRKSDLRRHEMIHSGETFKCNTCHFKSTRKGHLRIHEMIHTGETPFVCSTCNYKCRNKSQIRLHMMIHSGEAPFQCSTCSYKFRTKSELRRHTMIHTDDKPFKCSNCTYNGRRADYLQAHMKGCT